jgi:hypothetical protein
MKGGEHQSRPASKVTRNSQEIRLRFREPNERPLARLHNGKLAAVQWRMGGVAWKRRPGIVVPTFAAQ